MTLLENYKKLLIILIEKCNLLFKHFCLPSIQYKGSGGEQCLPDII